MSATSCRLGRCGTASSAAALSSCTSRSSKLTLSDSFPPAETGNFLYWYMGNIAIVRPLPR